MDIENARRNLRDFLTMYNQFTETCFERCIQNLNYRVLTPQEESCTNKCVSKLINVNHRQISVYMEINPLNRRLNEIGKTTDAQELQTTPPDLAQEVEKALGKDAVIAGDGPTAADILEPPSTTETAAVNMDSTSQSEAEGNGVSAQSIPQSETESGKIR